MEKTPIPKRLKYSPKTEKEAWKVKQKVLKLSKDLKDVNKKNETLGEALRVIEEILGKSSTIKSVGLSWLIKEKIFSNLDTATIMEVLKDCVKNEDSLSLEQILKATQRQSSLHTELALYKTKAGETLSHIAARMNRPETLFKIGQINPEYLKQKNNDGDTAMHTASRYLAIKSLRVGVKNFPSLFALRNSSGLRPQDLEGGKYITKRINDQEISQASLKEKETYQKAFDKLQKISTDQHSSKGKIKKQVEHIDTTELEIK
jgi:hypothetical protein